MIIKNIYTAHMNTLINGYKEALKSKSKVTGYGKKSDLYFSNVELSFELSGIKAFELRYLKDFASSIVIENEYIGRLTNSVFTDAGKNGEGEYYVERRDLLDQLNKKLNGSAAYMEKEFADKIEYPKELKLMSPIGAYQYDVIARFEGTSILAVLGVFPDIKLKNSKTGEFFELDSKEFKNSMAASFVSQFYNYIQSTIDIIDVLTDVQMSNNFFNCFDVMNDKFVVLSHINTPYGGVSCININPEDYKSKMVDIMNSMFSAKDAGSRINAKKDVSIYAACNITLQTYLYLKTHTNLVSYEEDFNTIICENSALSVPEELPDEYKVSFIQNVKTTDAFRKAALKDLKTEEATALKQMQRKKTQEGYMLNQVVTKPTYNKIELYEYIPSCARINCMLKFSIQDFYTNPIESNLSYELNQLYFQLSKFCAAIEKTFKKAIPSEE